MKKLLGILVLGLFLSNSSIAARYDPNKIGANITFWERIVWFFEDLFESDNDEEIKQLKSRIKYLERNQTSAEKNARKIQEIRDCLETDLEKLMCAGID